MRRLLLFLLLAPLLAGAATAQPTGLGVGVIFGEPTGISLKTWVSDRAALAGAAAWSLEGRRALHLHADWLWHETQIARREGTLHPYAGIGARYQAMRGRRDRFGARIPLGLSYHPQRHPSIELFIEAVPVLDLTPSTSGSLNGGIGIRWFLR